MKKCAHCGTENEDAATSCSACKSGEFTSSFAPPVRLEFTTPTPEQMQMDLVTLLRCSTLLEADLLVSQLEAAGIPTFMPDQFLMQNVAFNLNTYGYVRIQVEPKDFEAAKELLSTQAVKD